MPKLLICASEAKPKDRKAATSSVNLKKLIEKRIEKDKTDVAYTVVTLNTKMKLANVVAIINSPMKKLMEHEGVQTIEKYTIDPEKTRGRWDIENVKAEKGDGEKKAKKKKKAKEE